MCQHFDAFAEGGFKGESGGVAHGDAAFETVLSDLNQLLGIGQVHPPRSEPLQHPFLHFPPMLILQVDGGGLRNTG